MAEQNFNVVDFDELPEANDGKTVLYNGEQVCQSEKTLGETIDDKILDKDFATKPWVESLFTFRDYEVKINYEDIEDRDIWIVFKFLDKSYNPQEHQLAMGQNATRDDELGDLERHKEFAADWQLMDAEENVWLWGVTQGTDINHAFAYTKRAGEKSTSFIIEPNWIDNIPEELGSIDGYSPEECLLYVNNGTWPMIPEEEYTGRVNILSLDLSKATGGFNLFSGIPWVGVALYGEVPSFKVGSGNWNQMFLRCFHVTKYGDVDFTTTDNAECFQAFYTNIGLIEIPNVKYTTRPNLTNMFKGCCYASKESIEASYNYLNAIGGYNTGSTFEKCGIYADPTALDNIPASWGGNLN